MDVLTPIVIQLLVDFALGFVVAMIWRQTWLRVLSALALPIGVVLFMLEMSFFLPLSGHSNAFWWFCASFVGFGFAATVAGTLVGAITRQALSVGRCP